MEPKNSSRLYLSKITTAYECPKKYYFRYHLWLKSKEINVPMANGAFFHKVLQIYLVEGLPFAVNFINTSNYKDSDKENFYLMLDVLRLKFDEVIETTGFNLLSNEQAFFFPLLNDEAFFKKWYIKSDFVFENTQGVWNGELKTTSGYGASTAQYYHNSLQTLTYFLINQIALPNLKGTNLIVVTTKNPRCFWEFIIPSKQTIMKARLFIETAVRYMERIEQEKVYERNMTSCLKARSAECEFVPICFLDFDSSYVQEMITTLYVIEDSDTHLELGNQNNKEVIKK